MRVIAILNPAADSGRTGRRRGVVEAALRAAGLEGELWLTEGPGHAVALAQQAARQAEAVLAVGGDGTIQEVCRGLLADGGGAHLGVLPMGTGNDFVKMLGLPRRPEAAARALATAIPRALDYGFIRWIEDDRQHAQVFINAAGAGFDARAAVVAYTYKHWPGITGYLAAVLHTLRQWVSPQARIVVSTTPSEQPRAFYEGPLLLVTAGNGISSGGMFRLTPHASLSDGLLDVCLVEHMSIPRILQVLPRAIRGTHEMAQEVHTARVTTVEITADAGLPVHADGEILAQSARFVHITVIAGGLSVLVPP